MVWKKESRSCATWNALAHKTNVDRNSERLISATARKRKRRKLSFHVKMKFARWNSTLFLSLLLKTQSCRERTHFFSTVLLFFFVPPVMRNWIDSKRCKQIHRFSHDELNVLAAICVCIEDTMESTRRWWLFVCLRWRKRCCWKNTEKNIGRLHLARITFTFSVSLYAWNSY